MRWHFFHRLPGVDVCFSISIQQADFDVGAEYQTLVEGDQGAGAVVFFVGRVRDNNLARAVAGLFLEHYPGMTEQVLEEILAQARQRWQLSAARIVHRVGDLAPGAQIVFVAAASPHRGDAFAAAEFMMDILKTSAPFWKKETTPEGDLWLDARETDQQAGERWLAR